jgi:hypothetical protein
MSLEMNLDKVGRMNRTFQRILPLSTSRLPMQRFHGIARFVKMSLPTWIAFTLPLLCAEPNKYSKI